MIGRSVLRVVTQNLLGDRTNMRVPAGDHLGVMANLEATDGDRAGSP